MARREEDNERKELKVNDKRRFDITGRERGEEGAASNLEQPASSRSSEAVPRAVPTEGSPPASAEIKGEDAMTPQGNESNKGSPEITFTSFVISLATQTLMQLGEMAPPQGVNLPVDFEGASQTIEILSMLQKKTKGNLTAEEEKLIEEVMHNLRLTFVQKKKEGTK